MNERALTVALLGNPNAGKSSVFNHLTGLNQKVGNFPGVTVDKKTGTCVLAEGQKAQVIDLPGTYSYYPKSLDERVVFDVLSHPGGPYYPDVAVVVADATNLKRNLLLFTQVRDLGLPTVLALNMLDMADQRGIRIDLAQLATDLGVPVVGINGRTGAGLPQLRQAIATVPKRDFAPFFTPPDTWQPALKTLRQELRLDSEYLAWQYLQQTPFHANERSAAQQAVQRQLNGHDFDLKHWRSREIIARYEKIDQLLAHSVQQEASPADEPAGVSRLDRVLTHPVLGYVIFFGALLLIFQAIFAWAATPMDLIDGGVADLNEWLLRVLPAGPLTDLLTEGVIAGVGGVLIFIPQITLLFAFIALLEESGYMARVVFLTDRLMRPFGLNGRSVVPLISGLACAVPAVMATRTIDDWKERLTTIFVTPLMSCSARLPVYTILVALVVPNRAVLGFLNLQGLTLLGLYLLGFVAALLSAWALKVLLKAKTRGYLIMEMPAYQIPRWRNVGVTIWEKVRTFVVEAGRIIVAISIILWVLASYGPGSSLDSAETRIRRDYAAELTEKQLENRVAAARLEASYAGQLGKLIEPIIRPLGFDWKIGIALITSFAAREVFVGTVATIYSVGADLESERTILSRMRAEINPETGEARYTPALGFSLMVFYAFAMQCMSTVAIVRRETKGWRWPLLQLAYMTALAYVSSLAVYQLAS